jgi:hypothetical protein
MSVRWTQKPAILILSLAATIALGVAGCGGQPTEHGDAIAIPEPNANITKQAPSSAPAPTTSAAAPSSSATGSAPVTAEGWGTLKGQVTFGGDPPPVKVLQEKGKAEKNPEWCAKDTPIVSERLVVDAATKGVKNVLVYLPRPTKVNDDAKKAATGKTVEFDQKNCTFAPHVLGLMAGTTVVLRSSDQVNHNVDSKLKNSTFNTNLAGGGTFPYPVAASERTPGPVICDIHPWMSAYWMVVDHPYIAVTDDKGNFEIKNVPAGTQKVVVWQEATGFVTAPSGQDVTIKPNDVTGQDFTIDPTKVKPGG